MIQRIAFLTFIVAVNVVLFQNCSDPQGYSVDSKFLTSSVLPLSAQQQAAADRQLEVENSWKLPIATLTPAQTSCLPTNLYPYGLIPSNIKQLAIVDGILDADFQYDTWAVAAEAEAKFGNVMYVSIPTAKPTDLAILERRLQKIQSLSRKAVVNLQNVFFDRATMSPLSDYIQNWNGVAAILRKYEFLVVGFYLYDEPFWNAKLKNVSESLTYDLLVMENALVKNTFPKIATSFVEAYPMVNENLRIPPSIDMIGMDCYNGFDRCGDDTYGYKSIPEYYRILKSKMTPYQKMIILPPAMIIDPKYSNPANRLNIPLMEKLNVVDIGARYFEWIQQEPRIVGIYTFLYNYESQTEAMVSADKMCEVAEYYEKNGQKFLAGVDMILPINVLNVRAVASGFNQDYPLMEYLPADISSSSDIQIKFSIDSYSDTQTVRCEIFDSLGTSKDCSASLSDRLTIASSGSYRILIKQGELVKTYFINASLPAQKACVYSGGQEGTGCVFAAGTALHGERKSSPSMSGGSGSITATCNNGQWTEVQVVCGLPKKSCVYDGGQEGTTCIFAGGTALDGERKSSPATSGGIGSVTATCRDGVWTDVLVSCSP